MREQKHESLLFAYTFIIHLLCRQFKYLYTRKIKAGPPRLDRRRSGPPFKIIRFQVRREAFL